MYLSADLSRGLRADVKHETTQLSGRPAEEEGMPRDTLVLELEGQPLQSFDLDAPLTVGRARYCDVMLPDPDVPDIAGRVLRRHGGVFFEAESGRARAIGVDQPVALGRFALVRREGAPATVPRVTDALGTPEHAERLSIVVGAGGDVRRYVLDAPVIVGTSAACRVRLRDRAVSRRHCRIEPRPTGGVILRDLDSRNGTWVDGRRIGTIQLDAGACIAVGSSMLQLVRREKPETVSIVAESTAMRTVLAEVDRFAHIELPVLVQGESGVGKEGVARALHERSPRRRGPFVALNAAALTPTLVESELFGHTRGAFSGAVGEHRGVFEQAGGGTLFLDEIGELPSNLQSRLLRVLETWKVRRVGDERERAVDVRLVCATHRDLHAMADEGEFRHDLLYRLLQLVIAIPPLRERVDDVLPLARHFLSGAEPSVGPRELSPEAAEVLLAQPWPGNARVLRNVVVHAAALCGGRAVEAHHVHEALRRILGAPAETRATPHLEAVLARYGGNLSAAARALGMPRSTLRDRLKASRER